MKRIMVILVLLASFASIALIQHVLAGEENPSSTDIVINMPNNGSQVVNQITEESLESEYYEKSGSVPTEAWGQTVTIQNLAFNPQEIKVQKGETVTWVNKDNVMHTVTSDNGVFNSSTIAPGNTFSQTFDQEGTFNYHCEIHPFMHGKVIVGSGIIATPTPTVTPISTPTPLPTETPTPTPTSIPTPSVTPTPTPTPTPSPTVSSTPTATVTLAPTTPQPTETITPTEAPTVTIESTITITETSISSTPGVTEEVTPMPQPTETPVPTVNATPSPAVNITPEVTPTSTPQPTATVVPISQPSSHPSPEATADTAASPSAGPSFGGGGGACGEYVRSEETNITNIDHHETREYWVERNKIAEYSFTTLGFVKRAGFYANTSEGCISIRIEVLKGKPAGVEEDVSGNVSYFNIWAGDLGYINSPKAYAPFIVFAGVPDEMKGYDTVKLMYYEDDSWKELFESNVTQLEGNLTKVYTPGFGNFAFVGFNRTVVQAPAPTVTPSPTAITPAATAPPFGEGTKSNLLPIVAAIIIIAIIVLLASYLRRYKQKKLTDYGGGAEGVNILSESWLFLRRTYKKTKNWIKENIRKF